MIKNVRLTKYSSNILDELVTITNLSKIEIISIALKRLKREIFFNKADNFYKNISSLDQKALKAEEEVWASAALMDIKNDKF
jgi:hypothetical protein